MAAPTALHTHVDPAASGAADQFEVLLEDLNAVSGEVEVLPPRQADAARLVRLGKLEEAFAIISECVAAWQRIQVSLAHAATAVGRPVEQLAALALSPPDAPPEDNPLGTLAASLQALKLSVQSRDWVGLADTLEYDLGDLARRWSAALLQPDPAPAAPSPIDPNASGAPRARS